MIGEYLPQTNESATVPEAKIFCELNKTICWFVSVSYI